MNRILAVLAALAGVVAIGCDGETCDEHPCASQASQALPTAGFGAPDSKATTIVSLTFDDGRDDAYAAKDALAHAGLKGTFFVITSRVGVTGYMTWNQISDLQKSGHEIGGHTVHHLALAAVSPAVARSELCDCRTALLAQGVLPATSFSYPFNSVNSAVEALVAPCGFAQARAASGLDPTKGPIAESLPPRDRFWIRSERDVQTTDSLDALEQTVTATEDAGGGWVTLVFHHVSDVPTLPLSVSPSTLRQFADWLAARQSRGTSVKTFGEAAQLAP